jgi:tetratricopeptide (TPR) repeat protein
LADWLVSGLLALLGIMYMRNVAFVAVSLVPLTAFHVDRVRAVCGNFPRHVGRVIGLASLLVLTVVLASASAERWRDGVQEDLKNDFVPAAIGEFLARVPLQGNVFNEDAWGGYLIWRLYPQYKFFIDTRGIDKQVFDDYIKIRGVSRKEVSGMPEYLWLIEKYHIDYVVMYNQMEFGLMQKLLKYLLTEKNWMPIYLDNGGFVLARVNERTRSVVQTYGINKKIFLDQLLGYYDQTLRTHPERADLYLGRGELLGFLGRYNDAASDFEMVRRLDSGHPYLAEKLSQLQKLREKGH